jgi:hypothetical protein
VYPDHGTLAFEDTSRVWGNTHSIVHDVHINSQTRRVQDFGIEPPGFLIVFDVVSHTPAVHLTYRPEPRPFPRLPSLRERRPALRWRRRRFHFPDVPIEVQVWYCVVLDEFNAWITSAHRSDWLRASTIQAGVLPDQVVDRLLVHANAIKVQCIVVLKEAEIRCGQVDADIFKMSVEGMMLVKLDHILLFH